VIGLALFSLAVAPRNGLTVELQVFLMLYSVLQYKIECIQESPKSLIKDDLLAVMLNRLCVTLQVIWL
jgi:hypothetical protein